MKTFIITLLFSPLLSPAVAQLQGKVTTSNGESIPFANVLLLSVADSTLVRGAVTDETGTYRLESPDAGRFFMQFSAVGFQTVRSLPFEFAPSSADKDLGPQIMHEDTQQLDDVIIRAEKPLYQQAVDRTVVNVGSSVMTRGSSALQVLERSPGVFIDRQNSNIALNGKGGGMVMLDGQLMRLSVNEVVTLLESMSADNIETIELLTTPPAKYDADGSGGMINIITKKNQTNGTQASLSLTGGYGWGEKAAASATVDHNRESLSLHGSYAFRHDHSYSDLYVSGSQNVPALGGPLLVNFWNKYQPTSDSHNATADATIRIGKTSVGARLSYNRSQRASEVSNRGAYTILPDSFLLAQIAVDGTDYWENASATLYTEREMNADQTLAASLDYLYFDNDRRSDIYTTFFNRENQEVTPSGEAYATRLRSVAHTPIRIGVAKVDYTQAWGDQLTLEAGIKGTYTGSTSRSRIESQQTKGWMSNPETLNDNEMREGIGAIYASGQWQLNASTQLTTGARYEYSSTQVEAEQAENRVNRTFGKLFPNLLITKNISNQAALQLSYTERISRPTYNDLASFFAYSDPISVITGNPLLKPMITRNLKVGYTYAGYAFSALLSRDDNPIARYQVTESPNGNLLYVAPQNLAYQNNLTFQTDLPFQITEWWSTNQGFVGGWRQFQLAHTAEKVKKTYFAFSLYGSQTFSLPRDFSLEVSGFYNSPTYNGSWRIGGFGALNAGIKKSFGRGSLQLSVSDLLESMAIDNYAGTLTEEAFSVDVRSRYTTESARSRIIQFTFSRSFGNNSEEGRRAKRDATETERSRIRDGG